MYTIWVLALSLGVVVADIGLGYHYKVPETSYGVPSFQIGTSGYKTGISSSSASGTGNAGGGIGFSGTSQSPIYSTGSRVAGSSNTAYTTSGTGTGINYNTQGNAFGSGFNYNTQGSGSGYNYNGLNTGSSNQGAYQGSIGQNTQSILDGYYPTGGASTGSSHLNQASGSGVFNQFQTSNEYASSAGNKYQEYYNQIVQQPPQIFKHFYVHAAPEEPEAPRPRQPLVLPAPQKHYKIIFIKTPAQQAPAPQLIPVPQQNEEKTIVYVLVKKPEDAQNIVLPKIEQKPPVKPEVFFIKYNNKQDSQSLINNIVSDYNKGGVSTSFSGVETGYSAGVKESGSRGTTGVIGGIGSSTEFGSVTSGSGISDGSYAVSTVSSGNANGGAASQVENQGSGSVETQFSSAGPTIVTSSGVDSNSFNSGLESIFGTPGTVVSTSTASSDLSGFDASAISTSQGVPHESYGVPKFKEY